MRHARLAAALAVGILSVGAAHQAMAQAPLPATAYKLTTEDGRMERDEVGVLTQTFVNPVGSYGDILTFEESGAGPTPSPYVYTHSVGSDILHAAKTSARIQYYFEIDGADDLDVPILFAYTMGYSATFIPNPYCGTCSSEIELQGFQAHDYVIVQPAGQSFSRQLISAYESRTFDANNNHSHDPYWNGKDIITGTNGAPASLSESAPLTILTNYKALVTLQVDLTNNYGDARAWIDPMITIDPDFLLAHPDLTLRFSPGIGNAAADGSGVPEPATWLFLVGGFAVVGAGLRRRRLSSPLAI